MMEVKRHSSFTKDDIAGFTLLEMVIVFLIISIMALSSVYTSKEALQSLNRSTGMVNVFQDLRRAQATAVTEGCRGILTIASSADSYTFGCDYLPYSTATPPVYDDQVFSRELPYGITISVDSQIIFNSRGQVIDSSEVLGNRIVTLTSVSGTGVTNYIVGTLRATGFFSYD